MAPYKGNPFKKAAPGGKLKAKLAEQIRSGRFKKRSKK